MKALPKVSIIMPTYKRPGTLSRAIDSVLAQDYENCEIIVVDDNDPASSFRKETELVMDKYLNNTSVKYIKHAKNCNGSVARNTGIRNSTGEFIALLDDDDEFLPRKISSQVAKMLSLDDSWGACYTGYLKHMHNGKIQKSTEQREGEVLVEALARSLYIYGGSNLLVRRNIVEELQGFDESFLRNQDLEFLVRILAKYKIAYVSGYHLEIHYDSRVTTITLEQLETIDQVYLESLKAYIELLNKKDQKKVYNMIILDRTKVYISRRKFVLAIKLLVANKVNFFVTVRYYIYLLNRKITNNCYGFKI